MRVELAAGVVDLMRRIGEAAVTLDLTLDLTSDLAQKRAVALPGPADEGAGFRRLSVGGIEVYWRQRLLIAGRDPAVTTRVAPRRLRVGTDGSALWARASYA